MQRLTLLNDVPGNPDWKAAVEQELRAVLDETSGPWTVRVRPVEAWQGGSGWSVEVTRPGHVWTLRVPEHDQNAGALARYVAEAVRPDRFRGSADGDGDDPSAMQ